MDLTGTTVPTWVMALAAAVLMLCMLIGLPLAGMAGRRRGRRMANPAAFTGAVEKAKDTALFLAALLPSLLVWLAVMGVSFIGLTGFARTVLQWDHWTNLLVPLSLDGISISFGAWAFVAVKRGRHPGRAYKIVLAAAAMSAMLNFVHGRSTWSIWAGLYLAFLSFAGMAMFHELLDQFMASYDDELGLKTRYPRFGQRWLYAPFSTFAARRAWIVDPPRNDLRPSVRNALSHAEAVKEAKRQRRLGGVAYVQQEQQAKLVEVLARNEVRAAKRGDLPIPVSPGADMLSSLTDPFSTLPPAPISPAVSLSPQPTPPSTRPARPADPPSAPANRSAAPSDTASAPANRSAAPLSRSAASSDAASTSRSGASATRSAAATEAGPAGEAVSANGSVPGGGAASPNGSVRGGEAAAAGGLAANGSAASGEVAAANGSVRGRVVAAANGSEASGEVAAGVSEAAAGVQGRAQGKATKAKAKQAAPVQPELTGEDLVPLDLQASTEQAERPARKTRQTRAERIRAEQAEAEQAAQAEAGQAAQDEAGQAAQDEAGQARQAGQAGREAVAEAQAEMAKAGRAARSRGDRAEQEGGAESAEAGRGTRSKGEQRVKLVDAVVEEAEPLAGRAQAEVPWGAAFMGQTFAVPGVMPTLQSRVWEILDAQVSRKDNLSAGHLVEAVLQTLAVPANREAVSDYIASWADEVQLGVRPHPRGPGVSIPEPDPAAAKAGYPFDVLARRPITIGSNVVTCPGCETTAALVFSGLHPRRPVEATCGCGQRWAITGLGSTRVWDTLAAELVAGHANLIGPQPLV